MDEKKQKNILYWLSIIGPVASAIKTCIEVIIEVIKGAKK